MDIVMNSNSYSGEFFEKIKNFSDMCRLSKIEQLLSDCLEKMPNSSPVDYIGDLNRADVMH